MSIYKDLNDLNLDVSEFDEHTLSESEQKRILKNVHNRIHPPKQKKKWLSIGAVVAAVCIISLTLIIDKGTIANMPFVSEPIEKYINEIDTPDYSSYKTKIGETQENSLGKLTLNEVMMDHQKVLLSATFEPADGVKFDYQTHIGPAIKVNGKECECITGGQSIELNESMFTIYNDIEVSEEILTDEVNIEISYDNWRYHFEEQEIIQQPWTFDVRVSQANLLAEKEVFEIDHTITLNNGDIVNVDKVVSTPISTTVYYDLSQSSSEDILFDIISDSGKQEIHSESYTSNEAGAVSFTRFKGLTFENNKYSLKAYNFDAEELSESTVPIN